MNSEFVQRLPSYGWTNLALLRQALAPTLD